MNRAHFLKHRRRYGWGLYFGVLLLMALGSIFSSNLNYIAHEAVTVFAGGRSLVRVYLYIAYAIALGIVSIALILHSKAKRHEPHHAHHAKKGLAATWPRDLFFGACILLLVINAVSFFVFAHAYGLPIHGQTLIYGNGEFTDIQAIHNHVLKGAMAIVATALTGNDTFENADIGAPYIGLVPENFYLLILLLLFTAIISAFITYGRMWREETIFRKGPVFAVTYSIVTFSVLSYTIDGGLMSQRALVAVGALAYLLYPRVRKMRIAAVAVMAYIAICSFFASVHLFLGSKSIVTFIQEDMKLLALSSFLLYAAHTIAKPKYVYIFGAIVCLALLLPDNRMYSIQVFRRTEIGTSTGNVLLYESPNKPNYSLYYRLGGISIYKFTQSDSEKTIGDVVDDNRLIDDYIPVRIPSKGCSLTSKSNNFLFTLASAEPIPKIEYADTVIKVHKVDSFKAGGLYRAHVTFKFAPCMPQRQYFYQAFFESRGLETFFIYDISSFKEKF